MNRFILIVILAAGFQAGAQTGETRIDSSRSSEGATSSFAVTPVLGLGAMTLKNTPWNSDGGVSTGGKFEVGGGTYTFETGLLYNAYNYKQTAADAKLRLHYLSVPLLAKFNFMGSSTRTVYMKAGVMPSFITIKQIEYDGILGKQTTSDVGAKNFDLPAIIGVGGAIQVARNKAIIVEANYHKGLVNVNEGPTDVKQDGVMITSGFIFAF